MKAEYKAQLHLQSPTRLINQDNVSPTGCGYALVTLRAADNPSRIYYHLVMTDAAAVPIEEGEGQIRYSGIVAEGSHSRTAAQSAVAFVQANQSRLIERMGQTEPYIDVVHKARRNAKGEIMNGAWSNVDILLHVPGYSNASFLAPSMVFALLSMMWRKPPLVKWSFVGGLGPYDRKLVGYPELKHTYLDGATVLDVSVLLVPSRNKPSLLDDLHRLERPGTSYELRGEKELIYTVDEDVKVTVKDGEQEYVKVQARGGQVLVLFCDTMLEMVEVAYERVWRSMP